ncbi:MAG TPA: hypothetical protein VHB73_01695, partial [Alphaproteobacteria bacterium]|nr:hypothetical protein [Alphaproteobacteria bacterium]
LMKLRDALKYIAENYDELVGAEEAALARSFRRLSGPSMRSMGLSSDIIGALANFMSANVPVDSILHCYLGMEAVRGPVPGESKYIQGFRAVKGMEIVSRLRGSGKLSDANRLMKEAEKKLHERGFDDFSFLAHGGNALVLKGEGPGRKAALRFVSGHDLRLQSVAILPCETLQFDYFNQQIEIMPLADEVHASFERPHSPEAKTWNQNVLYLVAMLHGEGKYYWRSTSARGDNIVRWNNGMWISDPGNIWESEDARAGNEETIAHFLKEKQVRLNPFDAAGISTSEFFVAHIEKRRGAGQYVQAWAEGEGVHAIHLQDIKLPTLRTPRDVTLLVDISRARNGVQLAESLRTALRPDVRGPRPNLGAQTLC